MNDPIQPITAAADNADTVDPHRTPRLIEHAQMREYQEQGLVTLLSTHQRHQMFVRYDGVWWIGDRDGFIEITSSDHNAKLDRWHQRLANGALWE